MSDLHEFRVDQIICDGGGDHLSIYTNSGWIKEFVMGEVNTYIKTKLLTYLNWHLLI